VKNVKNTGIKGKAIKKK